MLDNVQASGACIICTCGQPNGNNSIEEEIKYGELIPIRLHEKSDHWACSACVKALTSDNSRTIKCPFCRQVSDYDYEPVFVEIYSLIRQGDSNAALQMIIKEEKFTKNVAAYQTEIENIITESIRHDSIIILNYVEAETKILLVLRDTHNDFLTRCLHIAIKQRSPMLRALCCLMNQEQLAKMLCNYRHNFLCQCFIDNNLENAVVLLMHGANPLVPADQYITAFGIFLQNSHLNPQNVSDATYCNLFDMMVQQVICNGGVADQNSLFCNRFAPGSCNPFMLTNKLCLMEKLVAIGFDICMEYMSMNALFNISLHYDFENEMRPALRFLLQSNVNPRQVSSCGLTPITALLNKLWHWEISQVENVLLHQHRCALIQNASYCIEILAIKGTDVKQPIYTTMICAFDMCSKLVAYSHEYASLWSVVTGDYDEATHEIVTWPLDKNGFLVLE
jgi:hypothetical protein